MTLFAWSLEHNQSILVCWLDFWGGKDRRAPTRVPFPGTSISERPCSNRDFPGARAHPFFCTRAHVREHSIFYYWPRAPVKVPFSVASHLCAHSSISTSCLFLLTQYTSWCISHCPRPNGKKRPRLRCTHTCASAKVINWNLELFKTLGMRGGKKWICPWQG